MQILDFIQSAAVKVLPNSEFKELTDFISKHPGPANWNDVMTTLIICVTVVVCAAVLSIAVSYCFNKSCKARLGEQAARQEFELLKIDREHEAMERKREHEAQLRRKESKEN